MPDPTESLERPMASTATLADSNAVSVHNISEELNTLLADVFALFLKTKNFHWHVSGPHFRDYHLLLDEQADQIYAMDPAISNRTACVPTDMPGSANGVVPTRFPSMITVAPVGRDSIVSEAVNAGRDSEAAGAVPRASVSVSVSVDAGCEGVMTTRRSTVV